MSTIGKFVGGATSVISKQLQTVTGGVSKWLNKDKTKIANGISSISNNVSSGISNIGSFYESVFTTLGGSVDRMRPTMETAIATFLSGISGLGLSVGEILTTAFDIATANLATWSTENETIIGLFFDNIQGTFAQGAEFLGGVMTDVSEILTGWWYTDGQSAFDDICGAFTNVGTTLLNVYNKWIKPVVDCVVGIFKDCWEYTLKPIFEQVVTFFGQLMNCIATVWNNFLSPIVNWIIDRCVPLIKNSLTIVRSVFQTAFDYIGGVVKGFVKMLGGVLDFITGVFKGDWKKAWTGIKDFVGGIWDMMWAGIKGTINLMIDGINALWSGFYTALSGIVNGIGSIAKTIGEVLGTDDWGWEIPSEPPLIPKLAKGGLVKAPTLALVGDNAGASTGNPEVVAPLNKLQGMLNQGDGSAEDTAILSQILQYLIKIYEAITSEGNTNIIELIAKLDDGVLFKRMIELNKQYKKRHNGKSAFA
jgi:phage-related protein